MCIRWLQFKVFLYSFVLIRPTVGQSEQENPVASVIRKTFVATAKSCMNHVNATQEDLEYLRNDPPYPEKSSCIIMCLLEKHLLVLLHFLHSCPNRCDDHGRQWSLEIRVSVVKNNKYSKSGFMLAVSPLVLGNKKKLDHMRTVSENCDKEVNHHEVAPCQLGNEIITCVYKYAPELHLKN